MQTFFQYNWLVRERWYEWCQEVPYEELVRQRTGGVGSILKTLFHIADVEWSWIRVLQELPDFEEDFEDYNTLELVKQLDGRFRSEVEPFVMAWNERLETRPYIWKRADGTSSVVAWGEVMRHVLAHEIHHIGQLSVWAREIGRTPVSANVVGNGLIKAEGIHLK